MERLLRKVYKPWYPKYREGGGRGANHSGYCRRNGGYSLPDARSLYDRQQRPRFKNNSQRHQPRHARRRQTARPLSRLRANRPPQLDASQRRRSIPCRKREHRPLHRRLWHPQLHPQTPRPARSVPRPQTRRRLRVFGVQQGEQSLLGGGL